MRTLPSISEYLATFRAARSALRRDVAMADAMIDYCLPTAASLLEFGFTDAEVAEHAEAAWVLARREDAAFAERLAAERGDVAPEPVEPEVVDEFIRQAGDLGLSRTVIERIIQEDYKGAFQLWTDEKGVQGEEWYRLLLTLHYLPFTPRPETQGDNRQDVAGSEVAA